MAGCKYVKDFEFPASEGFTASAGKQMVKGYARGGACYAEGGSAPRSGADMIRRLESVTPGGRRLTDRQRRAMEKEGTALVREEKEVIIPRPKPVNRAKGGDVRAARATEALNARPALPEQAKGTRPAVLKKGGKVGAAKIGKVMKEYKEGTLHSGSKKGPEVTNRKQAVAIALSEARKAGKKAHGGVMKKARGGPVKKADGGVVNPMMVGAPAPAPGMVGVTAAPVAQSPVDYSGRYQGDQENRFRGFDENSRDPHAYRDSDNRRPMRDGSARNAAFMVQRPISAPQPVPQTGMNQQATSALNNVLQNLPPQMLARVTPEMMQNLQARLSSAIANGNMPQIMQKLQSRFPSAPVNNMPGSVPSYSSEPMISPPAGALPAMKRGGVYKK